jgi:hypothetical protein
VWIDGQDVLDGKSLILNPNETVELEGFLRGMQGRNKFRFIQKTKEISDHRGDRIDDGLIRVEFAYEKPAPEFSIKSIIHDHHHHYHHHHHDRGFSPYTPDVYYTSNASDRSSDIATGSKMSKNVGSELRCHVPGSELRSKLRGVNYSNTNEPIQSNFTCDGSQNVQSSNMQNVVNQVQTPIDDMGITVKGSEINQQFDYGYIGSTDPSEVIVIHMRGTTDRGNVVQQPVTVQTKLTCSSCGRKWSSNNKFCGNCGTFLE